MADAQIWTRETYTIRNNVGMAVKRSLGVSVRALVASQVPDDQRLVAGTRKEHVGVLERGRKGSDPSCVALKGALENQLFGHDEMSLGGAQSNLRRRIEDIQIEVEIWSVGCSKRTALVNASGGGGSQYQQPQA